MNKATRIELEGPLEVGTPFFGKLSSLLALTQLALCNFILNVAIMSTDACLSYALVTCEILADNSPITAHIGIKRIRKTQK